jgi:hypothetical protein
MHYVGHSEGYHKAELEQRGSRNARGGVARGVADCASVDDFERSFQPSPGRRHERGDAGTASITMPAATSSTYDFRLA